MLKPALVRGDFRVIGATTSDEYEKWVEGDPALERRFQKVVVRELGELETMEILARAQGAARASSQCAHLRRGACAPPSSSPIGT